MDIVQKVGRSAACQIFWGMFSQNINHTTQRSFWVTQELFWVTQGLSLVIQGLSLVTQGASCELNEVKNHLKKDTQACPKVGRGAPLFGQCPYL